MRIPYCKSYHRLSILACRYWAETEVGFLRKYGMFIVQLENKHRSPRSKNTNYNICHLPEASPISLFTVFNTKVLKAPKISSSFCAKVPDFNVHRKWKSIKNRYLNNRKTDQFVFGMYGGARYCVQYSLSIGFWGYEVNPGTVGDGFKAVPF
jgi:hypothetical protein